MDFTLILVTVLSLTLATVMTVLAWKLAREERRRSEARVAALAAEIHTGGDLPLRFPQRQSATATSGDLFTTAQPERSRLAAIAAIGALTVVSVGVLLIVGPSIGRSPGAISAATKGTAAPAPATAPPLELVAMTHERDADRFVVRGLVRNPSSGALMSGVTAVVFLFGQDGGFITSGRAAFDGALAPGVEAPFSVTIPGAADVGRYRVSFRTGDRVVAHVDRRDRAPARTAER